jgi:hypothetical protein
VAAVVSEGWPGEPTLERAWRLIGPLKLLQAVEAAKERANGASTQGRCVLSFSRRFFARRLRPAICTVNHS